MKKILLSLLIAGVVQNSYAMQDDLQAADVGVAGSGQAAMLAASCAELAELSQENMQYAALLDAIVQNNIAAVRKMLTEGVSVFVVGPENTTLYQDVIDMPNVNPAILSILDQAASEVIPVDLVNQKVKTPYLVASSTANQLLKSNNGSINHPLLRRESATVLSLNDSLNHWQNIDMFEKLAEGDPLMLESFLSEKKLKLLLSSESGRKVFNRAFLIACNKLNKLVDRSLPTLYEAARSGDTILAQRLISAGTDVDDRLFRNFTALMDATEYGHTEIAQLLINAGANVNARSNFGNTVLQYAAEYGRTEIAKLLIDAGADVNAKTIYNETALMDAAKHGHTEIVQLFINAGAEINIHDFLRDGRTALLWAAQHGHTEIVQLLIDAGADVNATDYPGDTALMSAVKHGHTEIVQLLIDAGADVNTRDIISIGGRTALMWATQLGYFEIAKLLIDAGADVNALRNNDSLEGTARTGTLISAYRNNGITALMSATNYDRTEIAKLLIAAGADVNAKTNYGITTLMIAAYTGRTEIAKLLIAAGADVNAIDNFPRTVLIFAAEKGHTEITQLLIAAGADVNARDYLDHTALFYAEQGGYTEIVSLLIDAGAYRNVGEAIHKFILKHPNFFKAATISAVAGIGYKIWQNSQK